MIRVTVSYRNEPDKKFDWDYFVGEHMVVLHRELDHRGLVRVEIDKGISAADPNAAAPFIAAAPSDFQHRRGCPCGLRRRG